jgi:hypothetical protein
MSTTYIRPADSLRSALKEAGFGARRVTVRTDGSTLRVTIRDASASLTKVKVIADRFESVRRCEASGEILAGGNTYVDTEYSEALVAPIKSALVAVLEPAPADEFIALPGGFRAFKVSREYGGASYLAQIRMEGPTFDYRNNLATGVTWAAERLAVAYLDAAASGEGTAA